MLSRYSTSLPPALSETYNTLYAPVIHTVPLPPCPGHDHAQASPPHPLFPSTPRVHAVLSVAPTVVHYDFRHNPETIRMSSSVYFFPAYDPASSPSVFVLYVHCETTGHRIRVHSGSGVVTCLDLMLQLYIFFDEEMERDEWRRVRGARRSAMKKAYERRTGFVYSASARMKRVDCLSGRTRFKRLVPEYDGDSTWLLQTR